MAVEAYWLLLQGLLITIARRDSRMFVLKDPRRQLTRFYWSTFRFQSEL